MYIFHNNFNLISWGPRDKPDQTRPDSVVCLVTRTICKYDANCHLHILEYFPIY